MEKVDSNNTVFANDLCARLNRLFAEADTETHTALHDMFETRICVSDTVADHPDITVSQDNRLGILGILNGAVQQGRQVTRNAQFRIAMQIDGENIKFLVIESQDPVLE
jgi:hypothetical protein